jgi:rhodanese-related sulfurtransferase
MNISYLMWAIIAIVCIYILYYWLQLILNSNPLAIYPKDAIELIGSEHFQIILDVRTDEEWQSGHLPLAQHLPMSSLDYVRTYIPDKQKIILVYCRTGLRAKIAAYKLLEMGYINVKYLVGDWNELMKYPATFKY